MGLIELAKAYKADYETLERRIAELMEMQKTTKGENLYLLRKKIREYKEMARECKSIARWLESYYTDEKGNIDENRLHRQEYVGMYNAVLDTL